MTEIVHDEEHNGGVPTIAGTGIRVIDVAGAYEHSDYSPDEIITFYPALTHEDVHTAIAYYHGQIGDSRTVA